jgi:uncharacterized MnhB-related membrane protein
MLLNLIGVVTRHLTAVVLSYFTLSVVPFLQAYGFDAQAVADAESAVGAGVSTALLLAFYAAYEKVLKPVFAKLPIAGHPPVPAD